MTTPGGRSPAPLKHVHSVEAGTVSLAKARHSMHRTFATTEATGSSLLLPQASCATAATPLRWAWGTVEPSQTREQVPPAGLPVERLGVAHDAENAEPTMPDPRSTATLRMTVVNLVIEASLRTRGYPPPGLPVPSALFLVVKNEDVAYSILPSIQERFAA